MVLAGFRWFWLVVGDFGLFGVVGIRFGWLWVVLGGCRCFWPVLGSCGCIWEAVTDFDWF